MIAGLVAHGAGAVGEPQHRAVARANLVLVLADHAVALHQPLVFRPRLRMDVDRIGDVADAVDQILRRGVAHHPRQRRVGVEQRAAGRRDVDSVDRGLRTACGNFPRQAAVRPARAPPPRARRRHRPASGGTLRRRAQCRRSHCRRRSPGSRRSFRRRPPRGSSLRSRQADARCAEPPAARRTARSARRRCRARCSAISLRSSVRAKSRDSTWPRRALTSRSNSVTRWIRRPSAPSTSLSMSEICRSRIDMLTIASGIIVDGRAKLRIRDRHRAHALRGLFGSRRVTRQQRRGDPALGLEQGRARSGDRAFRRSRHRIFRAAAAARRSARRGG